RGESFTRSQIGICKHGRVLPCGLPIHWHHIGTIARQIVTDRSVCFLAVGVSHFGKTGLEQADDWPVQSVEPNHVSVSFVAMVVPGPAWRDDEVAWLHQCALAFHRGVCASALDDEA